MSAPRRRSSLGTAGSFNGLSARDRRSFAKSRRQDDDSAFVADDDDDDNSNNNSNQQQFRFELAAASETSGRQTRFAHSRAASGTSSFRRRTSLPAIPFKFDKVTKFLKNIFSLVLFIQL